MAKRRNFLVGFLLLVITLALYWPVTAFDFVNFDDDVYVYGNHWITQGLSWDGVKWAFTTMQAANWHPLTWISLMLDGSLNGLFPGGYHLTNAILHAVNALLLFLLLQRMTNSFWPGALTAALFAWHPLNVESVAWVSERKNVLSTLFLILTIWAYVRYVERQTFRRYALALALFMLGLMSKPMLVTTPCVLLLLDYWPLNRMSFEPASEPQKTCLKLFLEKIPFFILSFAVGVATLAAQAGTSIVSLRQVSFPLRLLNAAESCLDYMEKAVWPAKLCVFYPLPSALPVVGGIAAFAVLAGLTALVFRGQPRFRWLLAGWLWFLITLLPVIGLIQTGWQAMADRHAYVPMIGLFLAAAWSADHWLRARPQFRPLAAVAMAILLFSCLAATRLQLAYWRNSITLFTHAIAVTKNNSIAHYNLGCALAESGEKTEAIAEYEMAIRINPEHSGAHYNLGIELANRGKLADAEAQLVEATKLEPFNPMFHNGLGTLLAREGKRGLAAGHFEEAMRIQRDYPSPYFNLGKMLLMEGQPRAAITNFNTALKLNPGWPEALENLAKAYAATGDFSNAVATANLALKTAQAGFQQSLANQIAAELKVYQGAH